MPNTPKQFKYWAFISYSHTDKRWGDWLFKALDTYHVPKRLVGKDVRDGKVPKRIFPIFRDREELPGSSSLSDNINEALRESRYLIVICSPRSAQSHWVGEEIRAFKHLGREDRILALIIEGEPNASDGKPGFSPKDECFHEAMRYRIVEGKNVRAEPIAPDARKGKDGKTNAKLKLIAGVLGVNYDEIKQRDLERRRRRIRIIVSSSLALIVAFGALTVGLFEKAHDVKQARKQTIQSQGETRRTRSRTDFFKADDEFRKGLKQEALALLAHAVRSDPANSAAGRRLLFLLLEQPWFVPSWNEKDRGNLPKKSEDPASIANRALAEKLVKKKLKGTQDAITAISDSADAVAIAQDGKLAVFDVSGGGEPRWAVPVVTLVQTIVFSPSEDVIVVGGGGHDEYGSSAELAWLDKNGQTKTFHSDGAPITAIAFSPDDRYFIASGILWDKFGNRFEAVSDAGDIGFSHDARSVSFDGTWWRQVGRQPVPQSLEEESPFSAELKQIVASTQEIIPEDERETWIRDTRTGKRIARKSLPEGIVEASLSPDVKHLLLFSRDNTARLWSIEKRDWVGATIHLPKPINDAIFSPDGSCFVTMSVDGGAGYGEFQFWDTETMRPLTNPISQTDIYGDAEGASLTGFRFDQSWRVFLLAGMEANDVETRSLDLLVPRSDEPVPDWVANLADAIAGNRLEDSGGLGAISLENRHDAIEIARSVSRNGTDTYSKVIRWWLDESDNRTVAPESGTHVLDYVKRRLESRKISDLILAGYAAPENADVFAELAEVSANEEGEDAKGIVLSARRRAFWPGAKLSKPLSIEKRQKGNAKPAQDDEGAMWFAEGEGIRTGELGETYPGEMFSDYQKAAELEHPAAQHQLGVMYAQGIEVQKDEKKAVEWYRNAADQGLAEAQYDLGVRLIKGEGVGRDVRAGLDLYRKAAEQGYAEAQCGLADHLRSGDGITKDPQTALEWYRKAAAQGYKEAIDKLRRYDAMDTRR